MASWWPPASPPAARRSRWSTCCGPPPASCCRLVGPTNAGAPNWRFVEIAPGDPGRESWVDVIPETEHVLLDVAASSDRLLVHHLVDACSWVSVHELSGEFEGIVDLPPLG